jgi:plastocyanin
MSRKIAEEKKRRRLCARLALLVLVLTGAGATGAGEAARSSAPCASPCAIEISDSGFHPLYSGSAVALGATVEWSNVGAQTHQVAQNVPGKHWVFRSPALSAGQYYDVIVSAGDWQYHDTLGGAGEAEFGVRPTIQVTHAAHAGRVTGTWATASSNTGRHYCGSWAVFAVGSGSHIVHFGPTKRIGGSLRQGQRLLDTQHKHFVLRSGADVSLFVRSGIEAGKCPEGGTAAGWSRTAQSRLVVL